MHWKTYIFACLSASLIQAETPEEIAGKAKEKVESWSAADPVKSDRKVHVIYFTPKGRPPAKDYQERLTGILEHIRNFYGSEMERLGLGKKTFDFAREAGGKAMIHVVEGDKPQSEYKGDDGHAIREFCLEKLSSTGIDFPNETYFLFCNLATWDEEKLEFSHDSPYYASGNFQRGTAWQLDSPELSVENLSKKEPIIKDGQYGRISLGKHNSIFIGGIAHELGHALGLPHCREWGAEADKGDALMGSGNRSYGDELRGDGKGSFLTLAHGLRLLSHPLFSGSTKDFKTESGSQIEAAVSVENGKLIATGKVSGTPDVYAVLAYVDPEGGGDYDAKTASALPAEDGSFSFELPAELLESEGQFRLFSLNVNGAASGFLSRSPFSWGYKKAGETYEFKKDLGRRR